jgi:hypothetical protein
MIKINKMNINIDDHFDNEFYQKNGIWCVIEKDDAGNFAGINLPKNLKPYSVLSDDEKKEIIKECKSKLKEDKKFIKDMPIEAQKDIIQYDTDHYYESLDEIVQSLKDETNDEIIISLSKKFYTTLIFIEVHNNYPYYYELEDMMNEENHERMMYEMEMLNDDPMSHSYKKKKKLVKKAKKTTL